MFVARLTRGCLLKYESCVHVSKLFPGYSNFIRENVLRREFSAGTATAPNEDYILRSPLSDVEIPNVTTLEYVREKSKRFDDRVAMVCGDTGEEHRFGEMWERVRSVGSGLARMGVAKGSTVALVIPNCPEFVVSFLGASATGATITTINSSYNAEEIARQLRDSEASVAVFHPTTRDVVKNAIDLLHSNSSCSTRVDCLISTHRGAELQRNMCLPALYEDDGGACPDSSKVNPSEDVLVLPYSSGTTGLPKGVMLTHSNIIANLQQVSHPDILLFDSPEQAEVMFGVIPMYHIYGMVACMLLSFSTGSKCVTFNKFDPHQYIASVIKYKPTVLHTVPPLLSFLVNTQTVLPEYMSSVRSMVCGAAPLGEALVNQIKQKFGHGLRFQEGFGMTELSPVSHLSTAERYVPGSCGQPVSNTIAKIVEPETGNPLQPGEDSGELCVKGPQVMKGYFKNPEATAGTIDSEGWLHTGDVARVDSKGNTFIVDRLKELIKVKGFQVAPAELEDLLRTCSGVKDVAVVGVPDEKAGELPRAYVVRDDAEGSLTEEKLKDFLSARVSAHKQLAGGVVFLDAIPKSLTGKILRRELRDLAARS